MYNTIWLVNIPLYFYLITLKHECSNSKTQLCQGRTQWCCVFPSDKTWTNHCARTHFWWFCTPTPHLWSVQLPNWHFLIHPKIYVCTHHFLSVSIPIKKPLNCSPICTVNNFQHFQRQINIFNNPLWRRCFHFRLPYTLDSSGNFLWHR